MKKIYSMVLAGVMAAALLAGCGKTSEKIDETTNAETTAAETTTETTAASETYQDTVTVNPDDSQDFDPFEMVITYTVENGVLTTLDFSSDDWGRPALKQNPANARYCNKAIVTICKALVDGKAEADIDVVSGATCTSVSFKESLKNVDENALISWDAVSPELVFTIDGAELTEEEIEELLNTAYMAMKDPEAFNTLFSYDTESHILLANVDSEYMTSTACFPMKMVFLQT